MAQSKGSQSGVSKASTADPSQMSANRSAARTGTPVTFVQMDSRRFLERLNESAQARIAYIGSRVEQMGREAGKQWRLAALMGDTKKGHTLEMVIEDVAKGLYYQADYRREKGGKIVIENILPIRVVESGARSKLFLESCLELVNAIDGNDQKGMSAAFDKMSNQRFSSRAVPYSGKVRLRDGVVRQVTIHADSALDESSKSKLIAAVVESLKDRITIKDGVVLEAHFSGEQPLRLPVTKWSSYKLAARKMREVASEAYQSPGFQARVYELAKHIHEDKIEEAVQQAAPFMREFEEFTLLTRKQFHTLVENALAANGVFNQQLCDDTALMLYRTNLRVNRDTILKEWRRIAKAAQHPTLLENVDILGKAKNFEAAADKFLQLVFEAMSNRDVTAEALATTLEVLRDRTPKIKESHELASKLNDLITRLKDKAYDDNAIYEAEDFIATVQEELTAGEDLHNFDEMPGDTLPEEPEPGGAELGDAMKPPAGGQQQPSVVFNAPLISIGSDMADKLGMGGEEGGEGGEDEDLSALLGGEEEQAGGEEDAMMAGGGQAAAAGGTNMGFPESKQRGKALSEEWDEEKYGEAPWKKGKGKQGGKCKDCNCDPCECSTDESADPYRYSGSVDISERVGSDYGTPPLRDASDVIRVVNAMAKLAESHNLSGQALQENLEDLALAGFEATGMRIPPRKLSHAVDQVIAAFTEGLDEAPAAEIQDDHIAGMEDEGPAEDQFKWGTRRHVWGRKKAAIGPREKKGVKSESAIKWHQRQANALLGEMAGVRFVLDHDQQYEQPVILSEDGSVEVPIPDELVDGAMAAAGLSERMSPLGEQTDADRFIAWLREGLEQLRPETDEEAGALDAGMDEDPMAGEEDPMMGGMGEPGPGDELEAAGSDMEAAEDDLAAAGDELADAGSEMMDMPPDAMGAEDGLEGSTVTIRTSPDGTVQINVDAAHAEVIQGGDEELEGMQPVDSVMTEPEHVEAGAEEMPDFGDEEEPAEGPPAGGPPAGEAPPADSDDDFAEDHDVTSPKSSKYTKEVKGDLRSTPEVKLPGDGGSEIEGFGKKPKEAGKSGSDVSPARKGGDD